MLAGKGIRDAGLTADYHDTLCRTRSCCYMLGTFSAQIPSSGLQSSKHYPTWDHCPLPNTVCPVPNVPKPFTAFATERLLSV